MNKRIIGSLLMGVLTLPATAQVSTTVSPYSQFGMGVLADQSLGFNRGMSGLAYGLRSGKFINMQNPASYAAVDSLTMLFDVGVSAQVSRFKENGASAKANTGNFDYAVASFRLMPKVGVALGIVPFSNIGYNYSNKTNSTTTEKHNGNGGFSQLFVGAGWEFLPGLSAGFNVSYFWGKYDKYVSLTSSDAYVNSLTRLYQTTIQSYQLDFGVQYQQALNKDNLLTAGVTMALGHKLGGDAEVSTTSTNAQTSVSNVSPTQTVTDAFSVPFMLGAGVALTHKNSLTVGADYSLQKWSSQDYPVYSGNDYQAVGGYYQDRHKVTVGADWQPNPMGRKFLDHVHYRVGVSYATPYYYIKGIDGPKELTVSAGFGVPVFRSMVNVSGQWVNRNAAGLIKENVFRINVALTFNERWFAKWKVD